MASEPPERAAARPTAQYVERRSLRAAVESNFDGMIVIDSEGVVLFANPAAQGLLGRSSNQLVGAQFGFPHARDEPIELELVSGASPRVAEMRVVDIDWEGAPAFLASLRDVTERKRAQEASQRLAAIVEQSQDAILAFDRNGFITSWNRGAERLLGHRARDALGRPMMMLVPMHRAGEEREIMRRVLANQSVEYESERLRADGTHIEAWVTVSPIRDAGGAVIAGSEIARDISERKRMEQRLEHLATHDPLTGLLNRRGFGAELARAIAFAKRYQTPAAVLILDIDNFKYVNDSYGHALGDAALRQVSCLLRRRLRETDVIGRRGGDEFALILAGTTLDQARTVAHAVLEELRGDATLSCEHQVVRLTASIGIAAIEPDSRLAAEQLLANADIAMYEAKEGGRDRLAAADLTREGKPASMSRPGWTERIQDALEHERFVLHRQPITDLRTGGVQRAELLIRMRSNDHELLPPSSFLPIAERSGQIGAIDSWVIDRAFELLRGPTESPILHVNLSGATMLDSELTASLPGRVAREARDPTRLAFEITETVAIERIEHAKELAGRLAALGCQIVLDDFGSGFGSFYHLKHLAFDTLKIDGEFIKQITSATADRVTVQAIVEMARGLGRTTIAQCVENQSTLELLRRLGVDHAQGFHLGRPLPYWPPASRAAPPRASR